MGLLIDEDAVRRLREVRLAELVDDLSIYATATGASDYRVRSNLDGLGKL